MRRALLVEVVATATIGLLLAACEAASAGKPDPGARGKAAGRIAWVYHNGAYLWSGDFSASAEPYYYDKAGQPLGGPYDIRVSLLGKWGIFTPVARNWDFNLGPYAYFTFALKPTVPDQAMQVYFQQVGDKPVGVVVDPFKYGPAPVVGQWGTYRIPLTALGVTGARIYKIGIQDETGLSQNVFYLDAIGFLPPD